MHHYSLHYKHIPYACLGSSHFPAEDYLPIGNTGFTDLEHLLTKIISIEVQIVYMVHDQNT